MPEIDVWYYDNVMKYSRVSQANWRLDGVEHQQPGVPTVAARYRSGQAAHLAAAAALAPGRLQMGNTDSELNYPEYKGKLSAAFLEGDDGQVVLGGGVGAAGP